jgi:hypothetical protein
MQQKNVKILNDLINSSPGLEGEAWTEQGQPDRYSVSLICGWNRTLEQADLVFGAAKKLITTTGRLHEEFLGCMAERPPEFDRAEQIDDQLCKLFR